MLILHLLSINVSPDLLDSLNQFRHTLSVNIAIIILPHFFLIITNYKDKFDYLIYLYGTHNLACKFNYKSNFDRLINSFNINNRNIESIKDEYPEAYAKLNAILDHPSLGAKCSTMALPLDVKVPEWILPFVDFTSIINDALKNFPIESIGLKRLDNDNVNYSNIIQL